MTVQLSDELRAGAFADLPPSACLVYAILRSDGPKTRAELSEAANLTTETVSTAIYKLKARNVAGEQPAPRGSAAHRQCYVTPPDATQSPD